VLSLCGGAEAWLCFQEDIDLPAVEEEVDEGSRMEEVD